MVVYPTHLHLTEEELAALASLGPTGVDKSKLEHITVCDVCRGAVDEVAIYEAMWIASDGTMRWPGQPNRMPTTLVPRQSLFRRMRGKRYWQPVLAAVASIVVIGIGAREIAERRTHASLVEPVRTAILETARPSMIVIPGFEGVPATGEDGYRSGFVPLSEELDAALQRLAAAYREGSTDADVAVTLIGGYIATGQFGTAGSVARSALGRFPANVDIAVGGALADFGEGRLDSARLTLARIVEDRPENSLALVNLAAVLAAAGDEAAAVEMARRVIATSDEQAFIERAQLIIESHKPH